MSQVSTGTSIYMWLRDTIVEFCGVEEGNNRILGEFCDVALFNSNKCIIYKAIHSRRKKIYADYRINIAAVILLLYLIIGR